MPENRAIVASRRPEGGHCGWVTGRAVLARWTVMDRSRVISAAGEQYLLVGGQELRLTHVERVLYPATGTTKSDVIDYYVAVAGVMLPHLAGRPATRKRWPEGVDGAKFFVKQVEAGFPVWLSRVQVPHRWGGACYPVFDTPARAGVVGAGVRDRGARFRSGG